MDEDTIVLKEIRSEDAAKSLAIPKFNEKTLKTYCAAYNMFANDTKTLRNANKDEPDAVIERYISSQYAANPKPGNMTKRNQLYRMIRIEHPKIYRHLPLTKLKNWKHGHTPKSATAINSTMARAFSSYLNRPGDPYAAAAIVIKQVSFFRPCEVLSLDRDNILLPGHLSIEGGKKRVIELVINNGKTAKKVKPQLAFVEHPTTVKLLEVLMAGNTNHPKIANLFENTSYTHYNKQIQLAARYYGLHKGRLTPHGERIGKEVDNHRVDLKGITLDGIWANSDSTIEYIKNGQASLDKIGFSTCTQAKLRREGELYRKVVDRKWQKMTKEREDKNSKKGETNADRKSI